MLSCEQNVSVQKAPERSSATNEIKTDWSLTCNSNCEASFLCSNVNAVRIPFYISPLSLFMLLDPSRSHLLLLPDVLLSFPIHLETLNVSHGYCSQIYDCLSTWKHAVLLHRNKPSPGLL